ncbi:ATP-dependent RNA helicase DDX51 [Amphibalanus amphitrite]|uniref:ATP-dependent RNA helicase n=1 Tax=Amphibalanus amphitrite TaxID=1232801 RepID=A0A6A4WYP8_AMPAM|nr:ATP-dependent RNA helicase DDX51 [Amphibalanus amphitrite]
MPIGDRRPAPANLPALCPELRARLAAEGIEQVFLVQVTVLPELLAAAEPPLPPADLCVSAPAGRGTTLATTPTRRSASGCWVETQWHEGGSTNWWRWGRAARSPWLIVVSTPGWLMDHITSAEGFSLAHLRYLVIDEADRVIEMAETGWLKAFVGRFTTPAELSESFNVVAPQPLKPLLMHNLLRQPDWRRSLVLVNWNEAAHQLELPLSVLGAREAEFPGAVPAGQRRRAPAEMLRLMAQAGKVDGRVRETPVPLYELRQYEATYVSGFPR